MKKCIYGTMIFTLICVGGTKAYSFCWAMGGESQRFDDMDHIAVGGLK